MKLPDIVIERAVLEIFLEQSVPPGGRLPLSDLQKDWHRWHLRASDLHVGIRALEERGWVSLEKDGSQIFVTMNAEGYQHARVLPMRLTHVMDLFKHWSANAHKTRRKGSRAGDTERRRRADAVGV